MKRLFKSIFIIMILFGSLMTDVFAANETVPEAYKPVIEEYIQILNKEKTVDKNQYPDWITNDTATPETTAYSVCDVNNDGTPELLFTSINSYDGSFIDMPCSIYCIKDNKAQLLGRDHFEIGNQSRIFAYGEVKDRPSYSNKIMKFSSAGSMTSDDPTVATYTVYELKNGDLIFYESYTMTSVYTPTAVIDKFYTSNDSNNLYSHEIMKADAVELSMILTDRDNFYPVAYKPLTEYNKPLNPSEPSKPDSPSDTQPQQPSDSSKISIGRLYSEETGEHLFTTDQNEINVLSSQGWKYEGTAWNAPEVGSGVYRLYSNITKEHMYTADGNEVATLSSRGWSVDNNNQPLFYSGGDIPVYRLYHEGVSKHHLTTDANEYETLKNQGWNQEGIAFYGLSQ